MDFIALDFETAAPQRASACAMGITLVKSNEIVDCHSFLINPETRFNQRNTDIHGLSARDVKDASTFPEVWANVRRYFLRLPVVAHNAEFEKGVLEATARRYGFELPTILYYDTLSMARRNYPGRPSYSLGELCAELSIPLECHHECSADSMAAAHLMIHMLRNDDFEIFPFAIGERHSTADVYASPAYTRPAPIEKPDYAEANVQFDAGAFIHAFGSRFVVTGEIAGYKRDDVYAMIQRNGGTVAQSVSKKVQYVLVGMQDKNVVSDSANAKSRKVLEAEELRRGGHDIKIIRLEEFLKVFA